MNEEFGRVLGIFALVLGGGYILANLFEEDEISPTTNLLVSNFIETKDHLKDPLESEILDRGLTRTEALTPAREVSRVSDRSTVEKVSLPSLSIKMPSTKSRSWDTESFGTFLTSRKIDNSIIPLNNGIRKYPPSYYTLSKKAQWKYRKNQTKLT
jgi:hypothetical protein